MATMIFTLEMLKLRMHSNMSIDMAHKGRKL
jgi:hypothetical protein